MASPQSAVAAITRLRLASGLVLFAFVATHLANHALGLISLDAMESGRWLFLAGLERELCVLFADLRGFTSLSERRLPYDVVFLLNRYFEAVGAAIDVSAFRHEEITVRNRAGTIGIYVIDDVVSLPVS